MLNVNVGTRGYEFIDYNYTCNISGVYSCVPYHTFNNSIIIRKDLAFYCFDYLTYKFSLDKCGDIVLLWNIDKIHKNKVFRNTLKDDYTTTVNVITDFNNSFIQANWEKVKY